MLDLTLQQVRSQPLAALIFQRPRTRKAAQLFLEWLQGVEDGGATRKELSGFAADLEQRGIYSRTALYTVVLRRLRNLGLIGVQLHMKGLRMRSCYVAMLQPIPVKPPDPVRSLPYLMWTVCKRWNEYFWPQHPQQPETP